jgi:hypothetical protein
MLLRVDQALRELPLSEHQIAETASRLADSFLLREEIITNPDSGFFDFRRKINAIVEHFSPHHLTLQNYLKAAVKQPPLFYQAPATIIANIEGVAAHFRDLTISDYIQAAVKQPSLFYQSRATIIANIEGVAAHFHDLTTSDYIQAAVKQPSLFYQSPASIIANIEGVAAHFNDHGLAIHAYLRAAVKQPSLFYQSPATIIANIENVAAHFHDHGLAIHAYFQAAVKQPPLFYQSPATIIANIEGVANHFHAHGLAIHDYLRAAVKQPSLFCRSPTTIIRHVILIINLHQQGFITFSSKADATQGQPLKPMFDFLVKNPLYLTLSDDNYALREAYARLTGKKFNGTYLLTRKRHHVEHEYAEALRLADWHQPGRK